MAKRTMQRQMIRIECAYCRGTGRDRFGVMSPLSNCGACQGHGFQRVEAPVVRCAYCHGQGVSPTGTRTYCLACHGRGVQSRQGRTLPCPDCQGTGADHATGMYCFRCHGSGLVTPSRV